MLVLTRKVGEAVRVGDDVQVQVLGIRGGQVSLGFTAPREVRIYREEVIRAIERQNRDAALAGRDRLARAAEVWKGVRDGRRG